MKSTRPIKRSVSPLVLTGDFSAQDIDFSKFEHAVRLLQNELVTAFETVQGEPPQILHSFEDIVYLPDILRSLAESPANDAPGLLPLCQQLVLYRETLIQKSLQPSITRAMKELFFQKIQLFMVNENNVLFAKERDILIGNYFSLIFEAQPGELSEFIAEWVESDQWDSLAHFLDFCAGSNNPTFEHYLLFTHPALARLLRDKSFLKGIFERIAPLLKKLASPSWEEQTKKALQL